MNPIRRAQEALISLLLAFISSLNAKAEIWKNKRGMAGPIIGLVVGMIVVVVSLIVGLLVIGNFSTISGAMNYGSATGNSTAASIFTYSYQAFSLVVFVPVIMAAGVIISVISVYFYIKSQ